nr:cytochrome c biogenesis protein ResB [Salsipaludibacter albus]
MKTALIILAVLGVQTLLATVVPQEPNVPATVADWRSGVAGPGTAVSQVIDVFGGYDVYGSPLFLALLLLLFTSLTACLVPRIRAFWRSARHGRPPLSRNITRQEHVATFASPLAADEVHARTRTLLARRRHRLRSADADDLGDGQVAAEKGIVSREGGSLLFHLSFYVLLVGIVLGQLTGFLGQVGVVEGSGFTDTSQAYWSTQPGRWWGYDDHTDFQLELDEFRVDWVRDVRFGGTPSLFEADVTVTEADGDVRTDTISPNVPMVVDGQKIHLLDWGYAPRIVVSDGGRVVWDGTTTARVTDDGSFRTAVKAPGADPDVGLAVALYPWAPPGEDGTPQITGAPWADDPLLVVAAYRGDLRLDQVQDVNRLDTTGLDLVDTAFVRLGGEVELADGTTVAFPELSRWAGLQVSRRPTVGLLLAGAALLLAGLVPALYAYRRRVWVRAVDDPAGGSMVTVAGRAFQRPDAFTGEFEDLVPLLRQELDAVPEDGPDDHEDAAPDDRGTDDAAVAVTSPKGGDASAPTTPTSGEEKVTT